MIQPIALVSPVANPLLALAPGGDGAAFAATFDTSVATLLDAATPTGQPLAAPGKALPQAPAANVPLAAAVGVASPVAPIATIATTLAMQPLGDAVLVARAGGTIRSMVPGSGGDEPIPDDLPADTASKAMARSATSARVAQPNGPAVTRASCRPVCSGLDDDGGGDGGEADGTSADVPADDDVIDPAIVPDPPRPSPIPTSASPAAIAIATTTPLPTASPAKPDAAAPAARASRHSAVPSIDTSVATGLSMPATAPRGQATGIVPPADTSAVSPRSGVAATVPSPATPAVASPDMASGVVAPAMPAIDVPSSADRVAPHGSPQPSATPEQPTDPRAQADTAQPGAVTPDPLAAPTSATAIPVPAATPGTPPVVVSPSVASGSAPPGPAIRQAAAPAVTTRPAPEAGSGSDPRLASETRPAASLSVPAPAVRQTPRSAPAPAESILPAATGPAPVSAASPLPESRVARAIAPAASSAETMVVAPPTRETVDPPPPARDAPMLTRLAPSPAEAPPIAAGTTAPAFRLFAAALHAARTDETGQPALQPIAAATPVQPASIAAPAAVQGGPLDMADHRWPQGMIDRIEHLRDAAGAAADAASTSIRLVPDALGTIDVAVRRDGDTVHVHFAAEQAATRALLAEAQPRLAELAEARGIKLAQGDVAGGSGTGPGAGGTGGQDPRAPRTPIPRTPAIAARADDTERTTTTRIA